MESVGADERPDRVLLAAGTAYYAHADAVGGLLPEVPKALSRVVECLRGSGVVTLASDSRADVAARSELAGAEGIPPLPDPPGFLLDPTPTALYRELASAATAAPVVIVYYTGHGVKPEQQPYFLIATETDPAAWMDSAIRAGDFPLRLMPPTGAEPPDVLVILDCCFSGQGGQETLEAALHDLGNPNVWVLATAGSDEYARQGVFAEAFAEVLKDPPVGPSARDVPIFSLLDAIRERLPKDADQLAVVFPPGGRFTEVPEFFPNPKHYPAVAGQTVADQQHWLSRVRGGMETAPTGVYLTGRGGRLAAATDLSEWLAAPAARGLAVVTGSPGSGKSTLLALPVLLATESGREVLTGGDELTDHRGLTYAVMSGLDAYAEVIGIHARGLATDTVAQQVSMALGFSANTAAGLLEDLEQANLGDRRIVVFVDAVDEASHPATLVGGLLRPLAGQYVKVAIGARPHVLASIANMDLLIDLDDPRYQDPEALVDYVAALLTAAHEPHIDTAYKSQNPEDLRKVAAALAATATTALPNHRKAESFLLGRLLASAIRGREEPIDSTGPDWLGELPPNVGQAFDEELDRLGARRTTARVLLTALAWARGPGLPWENIWTPVAHAVAADSGEGPTGPFTDDDIRWLLKTCGSYVIEDAGPGGRSVYRLFHDLLAVHLRQNTRDNRDSNLIPNIEERSIGARRLHKAILGALLNTIPLDADQQRRWDLAHPYLRTCVAEYAALAGSSSLDRLLQEPDYLAAADPALLTPVLISRPSLDPALDDLVRAYLRARPLLADSPRANKAYLQEAAVVTAASATKALLEAGPIQPIYRTLLVGTIPDESFFAMPGHTAEGSEAFDIAFGTDTDGSPVLASAGVGRIRLWDPTTATALGDLVTEQSDLVNAVAFGIGADNAPLLASAGDDGTVRLWDPMSGIPIGDPLSGHVGEVNAVAFGSDSSGAPMLASAGDDGTVRLWDPLDATPLGDPLTGHSGEVSAVAFGTDTNGAALLATAGRDGTVRLWDPNNRTPLGDPLTGHTDRVNAVAFARDADRPPLLASAGSDGTVRLWDPISGTALGEPLIGHEGRVNSVAFGIDADGTPILASAGRDWTIRLWDPISGSPLRDPLIGHPSQVNAVAFPSARESPSFASAGVDGTVRLWGSTGRGASAPNPLSPRSGWIEAVAFGSDVDGHPILASAHVDGTVRLWDPVAGTALGSPLTGHSGWVSAVAFGSDPNGSPLLASAGEDKTIRMWDLATGRPIAEPMIGHPGWVFAVAFGKDANDVPLLASAGIGGTIHLWDPTSGTRRGRPMTGHHLWVNTVSFGTGADNAPLLASAGYDGTVRLWDPISGIPLHDPLIGHTAEVNAVAWGTGANGAPLLASGANDGTVRLWDPISGTPLGDPLIGHTGAVNGVAWGTDTNGELVLATVGGDEGSVRLWNPYTMREVAVLRRRGILTDVTIRSGTLEMAVSSWEGLGVIRLNTPLST